jgi:hypothetical protein
MRTALTGAMTTGEVVTDVNVFRTLGLRTSQRLVQRSVGERTPLESETVTSRRWSTPRSRRLKSRCATHRCQPSDGVDAVDTWLHSFRRSRL